jgi:hypothetical protein
MLQPQKEKCSISHICDRKGRNAAKEFKDRCAPGLSLDLRETAKIAFTAMRSELV